MHGVRWQSEARTPTPLWLGCGYSWPLHTPHGGGQMALLETTGCFWHKGTVSSQSGVALRFPPHSILWRPMRRSWFGVRWQSEVRTPTPLWLLDCNASHARSIAAHTHRSGTLRPRSGAGCPSHLPHLRFAPLPRTRTGAGRSAHGLGQDARATCLISGSLHAAHTHRSGTLRPRSGAGCPSHLPHLRLAPLPRTRTGAGRSAHGLGQDARATCLISGSLHCRAHAPERKKRPHTANLSIR
jgi:hypothetical protein